MAKKSRSKTTETKNSDAAEASNGASPRRTSAGKTTASRKTTRKTSRSSTSSKATKNSSTTSAGTGSGVEGRKKTGGRVNRTSILSGNKSKPSARRDISCYHCGHAHEVSERTMSTTCPQCNKAIKVEDVVVKSYVPVINLQTCGTISITRRGRVAATRLQASEGVFCEGAVEGSIESGGPTELGAKAVWKGKYLYSPSLTIEDGAQVQGNITVPVLPHEIERKPS